MLLKLENNYYLNMYASDNSPYEDNCDSVCGFNLFDDNRIYDDGGEFDYNSDEIKTNDELIKALIKWYFNEDLSYEFVAETDDCSYEDFDELLEENDIKL